MNGDDDGILRNFLVVHHLLGGVLEFDVDQRLCFLLHLAGPDIDGNVGKIVGVHEEFESGICRGLHHMPAVHSQ
ncbi:hypothetical protein SDC9_119281 [bioreactor metagenome]|uniref:Uncharacterized protein n=1 Tax=bioreactor metagenome TaxID=1076179 RepID=A0A645C4K3_9ZZZZ